MQTAAQTRSTVAFQARTCAAPRRATVVVRAQRGDDLVQQFGKQAAVAAAALVLTLAPASDATAATRLTKFQKNQIYEQELLESIKARTGKSEALPELTASPTDAVTAPAQRAPLKFDAPIEKVKVEAPASTPIPAPAVPAEVAVPKPEPVAAPKPVAAAPAPAPAKAAPAPAVTAEPAAAPVASEPADNKNLIAVGGIAVLAVAGLAVANNGSAEGQAAPAAAAPTAAAPAAAAGSDVLPNVAEARAWIAAWKKKHNKA